LSTTPSLSKKLLKRKINFSKVINNLFSETFPLIVSVYESNTAHRYCCN
jgi:hypothetical protein